MKRWMGGFAAALACGLVLASGISAQAQGTDPTSGTSVQKQRLAGKRQRGNRKVGKLAKELGLTDAQKAQIGSVLKDAKQQKQAIVSDPKSSQADKQAKLKELRKSTHAQILADLTPEQRERLKQLRHRRRGGALK